MFSVSVIGLILAPGSEPGAAKTSEPHFPGLSDEGAKTDYPRCRRDWR
jgi:hypothetical protein